MAFEIKNGVLKQYIEEDGVTEVTIPDGVTSIGKCAFCNCKSLTSVKIPYGVVKIDRSAFNRCKSLENITIPDSVKSIGNRAFERTEWLRSYPHDMVIINNILIKYKGCSADVVVPESVIKINARAFHKCINLTNITISDGIKCIAGSAFKSCSNLRTITIYKGDVRTVIALKHKWNINNQEEWRNCFISADVSKRQKYFEKMEFYYKISLAMFMMSAYPHETYYHDYMKNHTEDAVKYLTDTEDIDLLYKFFELGFVTEDSIDSLISYAVEHTQNGGSSEPQLILSKYKADNFSPKNTDTFDKFML